MDYSTFVPGIMSAPAGAPPASPPQDASTTKKRNRMLCQRCRRDKRGCHPQTRDWDRREKCERCHEHGYECSAPEKAPFKERKRRATLTTSPVHSFTHTSAISRSNDATTSMHRLTPSVSAPAPGKSTSRPLLAWGEGEDVSILPEDIVSSSTQPDPEGTSISARKPNEQEARIILAKLGDLNATRVVLLSDLELCDQVESWVGCSLGIEKIRDAIKAAIAAILHDFKAGLALAMPYATTKDIGPFREAFVSQVQLVVSRFSHRPARIESSATDEAVMLMEDFDVEVVQERLHELHKRKKVWSAADYLLGNAYGRSSSRHAVHGQSENDVVFCYLKASESIKDVFSDIVLEDLEHRKILCTGFSRTKDSISALPPCHLAVSQANPSVLLALWKKSAMPLWDVDYLRRTPVHSATYAGKVQGLQQIFQINPATITNTGCDSFGLTPLAIAACKDDVITFIRLEQAGAVLEGTNYDIVDNTGTRISILGLAARNGSVKVVEYIVSHPAPFNFQVGSFELCQALSNNQLHIAHILIDWHCMPDSDYDLSDQIVSAQQMAEERDLQDINIKLKSLMPDRQSGIQALDNMVFDTFTNHNAFGDESIPYDPSQFDSSQGCDFDTPFWSFSESHIPSFAPPDMQNSIVPTPSPGSGPSFTVPSNHGTRQIRHRGSNRMEPP